MRFLIIRHAEPDYANDSLTLKGFREAELLSLRLAALGVDKIYCSPLGRAKATAGPSAHALGLEPEILPWLTEFPIPLVKDNMNPNPSGHCPWNIFPEIWSADQRNFKLDEWRTSDLYAGTGIAQYYDNLSYNLDALMQQHGYKRNAHFFEIQPHAQSTQTVALFCHHGVGCAMLAHLCAVPLPLFWHSFFLTTSSVTTVLMERHHADNLTAIARLISVADTSHLYSGGEPVSASGLHSPIE